MKLTVITPVGPDHLEAVDRAIDSVQKAEKAFEVDHITLLDDGWGRSKTRNEAVKMTDSDWLFFLDADDILNPGAFVDFKPYIFLDAVWGQIVEIDNQQLKYRASQVPIIESYAELIKIHPFNSIQMGHFIRRDKWEPFNEEMDIGEDFDYYLRIWEKNNCKKVDESFFVNIRGSGGSEWEKTTTRMLSAL